jgi:hypothetical protein
MKKFLEKIQNLPESQRKIILWALVILIGLSFFIWYFKNMKLAPIDQDQLKSDLKIDELQKNLENVPKLEIPKI